MIQKSDHICGREVSSSSLSFLAEKIDIPEGMENFIEGHLIE